MSLAAIVAHFGLEVISTGGADLDWRRVTTADLNRPGLQWAGYTDHFSRARLQVIGRAEAGYILGLPEEERRRRLEGYCAMGFPAAIFTQGLRVPEWAVDIAESFGIPVFGTEVATLDFIANLNAYLALELAPRTLMHAGLVDVFGAGVLILGRSGIGKSETALELIRRGHRMVADDTVEIRRPSDRELIGRAPLLMRHFMEIKGIGIVNLRRMFGIGAVKASGGIDLVVALEQWDPDHSYPEVDALSRAESRIDILGVEVPVLTIPVQPGRNTAVLIESAAVTYRARPRAGIPGAGSESAADLYGRLR